MSQNNKNNRLKKLKIIFLVVLKLCGELATKSDFLQEKRSC